MAYDQSLGQRIRDCWEPTIPVVEKKMFGGVGFLLQGNMACGIIGSDLIVRVGTAGYEDALAQPHVRPFDTYGKSMSGWVLVGPPGIETDEALRQWIRRGIDYTLTMKPK